MFGKRAERFFGVSKKKGVPWDQLQSQEKEKKAPQGQFSGLGKGEK